MIQYDELTIVLKFADLDSILIMSKTNKFLNAAINKYISDISQEIITYSRLIQPKLLSVQSTADTKSLHLNSENDICETRNTESAKLITNIMILFNIHLIFRVSEMLRVLKKISLTTEYLITKNIVFNIPTIEKHTMKILLSNNSPLINILAKHITNINSSSMKEIIYESFVKQQIKYYSFSNIDDLLFDAATTNGFTNVVEILLKTRPRSKNNTFHLITAIKTSNAEMVKTILSSIDRNYLFDNDNGREGMTLLNGDCQTIKNKEDILHVLHNKYTPQNSMILIILLENNIFDKKTLSSRIMMNIISKAIRQNDSNLIDAILETKVDIFKSEILYLSLLYGNKKIIFSLLKNKLFITKNLCASYILLYIRHNSDVDIAKKLFSLDHIDLSDEENRLLREIEKRISSKKNHSDLLSIRNLLLKDNKVIMKILRESYSLNTIHSFNYYILLPLRILVYILNLLKI